MKSFESKPPLLRAWNTNYSRKQLSPVIHATFFSFFFLTKYKLSAQITKLCTRSPCTCTRRRRCFGAGDDHQQIKDRSLLRPKRPKYPNLSRIENRKKNVKPGKVRTPHQPGNHSCSTPRPPEATKLRP